MNVIEKENLPPGAVDWQSTRIRLDRNSGVPSSGIESCCSWQSLKTGEVPELFVSTEPASRIKIEIFCTRCPGWRGPCLLKDPGTFEGKEQPGPAIGGRRLRQCKWEETLCWRQGLSKPLGHILSWFRWNRPHGPDICVQKITVNLLNRAIGV